MLLVCAVTLGAQAQLLYKISGNGLKAPSYIIGTYHFADVKFTDSIPGLKRLSMRRNRYMANCA